MKKVFILLMTVGIYGAVQAQTGTVGTSTTSHPAYSASCQTQFSAINRSYDDQIASYNSNPKITATDREYRTLMLNFYRATKLSQAEVACTDGASHQYRSCLDQVNAINASYNNQVTATRNNSRISKQDRAARIEEINQARNVKLRQIQDACEPKS